MNTQDRFNVRTNLIDQGFKRIHATPDLNVVGNYAETWTHTDGTIVTIEWAPKTPEPTPDTLTGPEMDSDDESASEHSERILDAAYVCDFCEKPVPETDGVCRGCGSAENVRHVQDERTTDPYGNPLDEGVTSTPGMYDEPDQGIQFPLPVSNEEGRIR